MAGFSRHAETNAEGASFGCVCPYQESRFARSCRMAARTQPEEPILFNPEIL
jgi:hypothetical protein